MRPYKVYLTQPLRVFVFSRLVLLVEATLPHCCPLHQLAEVAIVLHHGGECRVFPLFLEGLHDAGDVESAVGYDPSRPQLEGGLWGSLSSRVAPGSRPGVSRRVLC